MIEDFQEDLKFEAADDAADEGEGLVLDLDGYGGPLHLLLELARKQKVDLARLSILDLAEQYIAFIKSAQDLRIELAADYLVMAAWLAYLKSRLILPREADDKEPEAEELAAHLAFRLERLEAMRRAVEGLHRLPITGTAIQVRGAPEGLRSRTSPIFEAEIFDLLKAYGTTRSRAAIRNHKLPRPRVMSLDDARNRLRRALTATGIDMTEWVELDGLLPDGAEIGVDGVPQASVRASSLLAGLELAKEGQIELRQLKAFAPIFLRGREKGDEA
ncbi:segregation/condensation protein A [Litorimonas cladophorae]|jgi:segregation and condensation protein A|uniref:Segregation and condensation protein A n=1 Tax=Litorimonas cladophorae TaxID=1220491 RepID=A0A918KCN7_9PROT|nr:ScpA family protein [Litorimonas cladophorae]GGX58181.1 segregation/condensation protein A [Litorimonas cladophorae]